MPGARGSLLRGLLLLAHHSAFCRFYGWKTRHQLPPLASVYKLVIARVKG